MSGFALPITKNPLRLADWMELQALVAGDGSCSRSDLETNLRRSGLFAPTEETEPTGEQDAADELILETFTEMELRGIAAGSAYPFELNLAAGTLVRRGDVATFAPYVFLLCLSYWGKTEAATKKKPFRRMFENLCCLAARNFVGGSVARFAAPRSALPAAYQAAVERLPTSFNKAVTRLCELMGEGVEYRDQPTMNSQDDKLDIVAWRDFPDKRKGKLVIFGQCASGNDWETKLRELNPRLFCEDWMAEVPQSNLTPVFFVPHRVEPAGWDHVNRQLLVFERCRLAHSIDTPARTVAVDDCAQWALEQLSTKQEDVAS